MCMWLGDLKADVDTNSIAERLQQEFAVQEMSLPQEMAALLERLRLAGS